MDTTLTNPGLLTKLLKASQTKKTQLKMAEVKELTGLTGTVGVRTLNKLYPELEFKQYAYKGVYYIKITAKKTKEEILAQIEQWYSSLKNLQTDFMMINYRKPKTKPRIKPTKGGNNI